MSADDYRSPTVMTTQLQLSTQCPTPGVASVMVTGEVDLATAAALYGALVDALATHHPVVLDVDLSACTFLDCSGIRVLVTIQARATTTGCLVRIRSPQPLVRLVLDLFGLPATFTAPADAKVEPTYPGSGSDVASPHRPPATDWAPAAPVCTPSQQGRNEAE